MHSETYANMSDEDLAAYYYRYNREFEFLKQQEKWIRELIHRFKERSNAFHQGKNEQKWVRDEIYKRGEAGNLFPLSNTHHSKSLSKAKLDAQMDDVCGICMDAHKVCDTLVTSCNHHFGKECFGKWAVICKKGGLCISCPMCKKICPSTIEYRARAPRKSKI
jgi:hypothetical protein